MACTSVIAPETARALYDRLVATQGADGCTLDEVATDRTRVTVVWRSAGAPLPAAEIVARDCAEADAVLGPTLAVRAPAALRSACPATVSAALAVVRNESFGAPARPQLWRPVAVGAACLAVLVFVVLLERRRRTGARPAGDGR